MADEQIVTSIVAKADLSSLVSEVHRASASLQQLQRELLSSNRAIAASTKLANNLFRDTLTGSGQYSSHFVNLNSDVDKFGKNLDAGRLKLKNYFSTFREHATTQKGMIRELAKEQVMLQNAVLQPLGRNAQGLMQYNVMIPRGLDAVRNSAQLARMEMQIMNRALSEGAGSLINWGKNTQWAGRQLTVGLTVPLTMFGAAAGKAFREADAELVRLTKVYGGLASTSAQDLKAIREEVVQTAKSLSQTMGASFKDTIALGADIAATGKMGNDLLESISETTRLSILGEVDRQDAMKATLSIQTAFKQNTEELTESINFLNAVENQTSTTLADLVEAIPKAGPVIQQLGGDVKDLALYLTAMREGGINASEGANALKSGLASLINPTKQTVGMMSDFGIDVMGMVAKNTGDTTGLLTDLQKALDSLDPLSKARAMEQMFGKFQFARMSALLNNLGKEGSQTLQVMELMKASTSDLAGIAERELGMITESASGKYRRAMESLKASLADIGEDFLPVATKLVNAAAKILDFFSNLPSPIKKAVTFLAGFTALVGPLIMLTGVLANFFGYITKGIVQLRAFFMKANGWKMLTPEIIAAQKAAEMVENAFYSDAAAAQVLHNALQKLVLDYQNLQAASMKNAVPVNPGVSTVGGAPVMVAGRRVVDPDDPYVGDVNTRAMSHINPRDPNNPATIFGGVPGAVPVNRGISRTPQIYMHDRLPNIEGLTSIKGISTGIVPGEAAKFHALMATLGMQTKQEVAELKKTIAMGGTVSRELLDTFDDILPITQRFADSAATQAAVIVQQMRSAEITVEQAKARILALNAQIEADMGAAVSMYAAGRGRTLDLTRAPMMDQPVVDANGQFTLRDLYKKKANASVMEEFGRLRGVRTFGAPYSIQTTRMPRFNTGGDVESFGPNKTMVSGPSSVNYDDRLGEVPLGGYVLNQQASMDPANAALVAMAPSTYLNNGGSITAALTPREVVFGPQIQRMPELYAAVDAANSGYNFGGQIMAGVTGYGKKTSSTPGSKMDERLFKKQYKEYLRFINNPRYEDDMRVRMIMLDAAELSYTAKMPMDQAIKTATSNFDSAKMQSGGSDEKFVKIRIKQVQDLEKKHKELKVKNARTAETSSSKALNYNLNKVRDAMLADKSFAGVHDLIRDVSPTTFKNRKGMPIIQGLHDRAHFRRRGTLGYMTSGYMGLAAVMPSGINNIMSRLEVLGLSRDVLNLSGADARDNFALALKKTGMDKFATVDDLYAAVMDDGKFKTKAQIESGKVIRANRKQRDSWSMFLQAAATRQKWIPGRPPRLVPAGYNLGGMIPGGAISRNRLNYGNIAPLLRLLTPSQQLKVLGHARSMSFTGRSPYPNTSYSHILSPSTGRSFPVPGVGGVYDDDQKNRVFFKAVPNEKSLVAETRGTEIGRILGLITPVQTRKTIPNPLDPTGKSKFFGAESPYDEGFINPNTAVAGKFSQDEVLDQLIASLIFGNKDLSRANVHGRRLADVGNGGVLAKASMNDDYAKTMPSMEEMAMINLLQVRGGARKDFAHDTAPIIAQMTPKQYGDAIREKMKAAYPELKKYILAIPKKERKPYLAMLERFEAGMDVDWAKYHSMHANPKFNAGGPVGGGPVQRNRYAYGRKKDGSRRLGNPATRAAQERARAERAAAYNPSSGSSYTATGNPQMQVARVPFVGGTGVRGNAYTGVPTESMARTVGVMRLAQFPHMNMPTMPMNIPGIGNTSAITAAFASMGNAIKRDSMQLAKAIKFNAQYISMSTKESAMSIVNRTKSAANTIITYTKAISSQVLASSKAQASRLKSAGSRFYNSIVAEQNAYAATRYPVGQAPPQGFFGPGYIGKYKDLGDGIQSRKVGSLGFRRTEYLVNGVSMTAKQAKAEGVKIPQRANGMSVGAQMGIGMAGSMGGMALMQKEKVKVFGTEMSGMTAGMGLMAATSIIPMLPLARMLTAVKAGATSAKAAIQGFSMTMKGLKAGIALLGRFAKGFGPIGIAIAVATAGFKIYKAVQDDWQDARMGLSMTAKAAEQAGVKYFNLQETMQGYLDKQKAVAVAAKASQFNSIGMPGLPKSVEDVKKAKEEGKALKEVIESINRSTSTEETKRLLSTQKAQYIAGGMSVEEANRKLYGALLNSNKAMQAYDILGNSAFGKIVDKATAAEYAVGNLINTLNKGSGTADWYKEVAVGFEGLINTFQAATSSLIGTKDAMGNVIDDYKAYDMVMSSSEKMYPGFTAPIGEEAYDNLSKTNKLLAGIVTKSDSVKSILAKWSLFTSGVSYDLSKIGPELAIQLAGFSEAVGSGITQLTKAGGDTTTFGNVGSALEKLKKQINSVSAASQRAAAAAQRSAQEELKLISKKIKLIDDEKNKKLESLRATQDASNYALELQKLQIEYADAVSRGDMATANRAQLEIDQLTLNRQSELAQKAIEDAANRAKAPLEKDADAIQNKADRDNNANQNATDNAAQAAEVSEKLVGFQQSYNELIERGIKAKLMPDPQRIKEEKKVQEGLLALAKELQTAGTGNTALAKAVREGFQKLKLFDKDGKPVSLTTKAPTTTGSGMPTIGPDGKVVTPSPIINPDLLKQFSKDMLAVSDIAEKITGGKTNLDRLRVDLLQALGVNPNKLSKTGVAGKTTGTGMPGDPKKYFDSSGREISEKEYKSLPVAPPKGANGVSGETFIVPIKGLNNREFTGYADANLKFAKANGGKLTYQDTNGYIYYSNGKVTKDGKTVGAWFAALPGGNGRLKSYHEGGKVFGEGTATSDSIPAMLSDGEYVFSAKAVDAAGGPDVVDALHKVLRLHKGGPVGHRHGRNLPGSKFKWSPYSEDMPNYWSDGTPSGSPYTQRWGELRYGPSKGKDIWGGTEIPGLPFSGKIANRSDYWHQMTEQPNKPSGPGMGIDKDPMRYAGSGASMGGIGSGVYGLGPLMFHAGGAVGHKHDVNPITKAFRFFKNAMNSGTNPASSMIMDIINQAGYLGQTGLSSLTKGIVPKPTKVQDKDFQEFTGIPSVYRSVTNKTDEGPLGKIDPTAGKIVDYAGALTFLTPWRSSSRMAANAAASAALPAAPPLSPIEMFRGQFDGFDVSGLPKGTMSTGPRVKPWEYETYKKILARHYLAKKPDPRTLTQHEVAVLAHQKVPGFEGLRVHDEYTAESIADSLKLRATFNYTSPLTKSVSTVEELLSKSLFHGGNLPTVDGKIDLKNRTGLDSWYGGQMFAAEDYRQALAYLMRSPENTVYSVTSALKKEDVIDLRHNANTLASQQPYVFAKLLRDIESGKIKLQDHQSKDYVISMLIGQEGGRYPRATAPGALRDRIFQRYFDDISPWLAENGIKAIIHRNGTRVAIPEIGKSVTDNPTRVENFDQLGTDAIAYTTVENSIAQIQKHTVTGQMVKDLIERMGKGQLPSSLESQILAMLRNPTLVPHKALGGLIESAGMRLPKFKAGINMVPQDMLALIHKNEAVIPANMNPFNPNATSSAVASGSVYNINVELNGTTVTAKDVAMEIHREMRIKEMASGVNRKVGG